MDEDPPPPATELQHAATERLWRTARFLPESARLLGTRYRALFLAYAPDTQPEGEAPAVADAMAFAHFTLNQNRVALLPPELRALRRDEQILRRRYRLNRLGSAVSAVEKGEAAALAGDIDRRAPVRRVSVVIPCHNEAAHIAELVARVLRVDLGALEREVIVVDDGSSDASAAVVSGLAGIRLLRHARNRGKGAALKTGFAAATGEVVLIQDADLEYDPADHRAVLAPILEGRADAVMGSRFAYERPTFFFGRRRSPFFAHYIGNISIVALTNTLYGHRASDYEGAIKAFRRDLLAQFPVTADGFEYDNELVCKLLRRGRLVAEVPIRYEPRSYAQGKKIRWHHGLRMLWTIVKWRFLPF